MLRAKQSWEKGNKKKKRVRTQRLLETPNTAAREAPSYLAFQPYAQLLRCLLQVVFEIQGTRDAAEAGRTTREKPRGGRFAFPLTAQYPNGLV